MMKIRLSLVGAAFSAFATLASAQSPQFLPFGVDQVRIWKTRGGCWIQMPKRQQLVNLNAAASIGSIQTKAGESAFAVFGVTADSTLIEPMSAELAKDLYVAAHRCLTTDP